MARKLVMREPIGDIEPVDVAAHPVAGGERLTFGKAEYEEAGTCAVCGTKVYKWVDNGYQNHEAVGNSLVVYVGFSHREPPGMYCQQHDPNAGHRAAAVILRPGDPIPGDNWRPRVV